MSFEFRAKANRISFKCGRYNSNCSAFARPDRAAQQNREKIGSSAGRQLSPSRCCGPIVDSAEISLMECVFIFSALALSAKPLTYELGCPAFSQDFHFSGVPTVSTGFICFLFGISGTAEGMVLNSEAKRPVPHNAQRYTGFTAYRKNLVGELRFLVEVRENGKGRW